MLCDPLGAASRSVHRGGAPGPRTHTSWGHTGGPTGARVGHKLVIISWASHLIHTHTHTKYIVSYECRDNYYLNTLIHVYIVFLDYFQYNILDCELIGWQQLCLDVIGGQWTENSELRKLFDWKLQHDLIVVSSGNCGVLEPPPSGPSMNCKLDSSFWHNGG